MTRALAEQTAKVRAAAIAPWQRVAGTVCALLLGLIFVVSGGWKVLDPFSSGEVLEQARVSAGWGHLGAASLGVLELLAAFLLFLPRYRRWGGLLGSALMLFFIGWVAYNYQALAGKECGCFPIIKRAVGPGFFISDGIMLLFGVAAFVWSPPRVARFKVPAIALVSLVALAGVSWAVQAAGRRNVQVPTPIVIDGKPQSIAEGKVFLFFYNPSCMHCDAASKFMSKLDWGNTHVVAIPTEDPQWAPSFLHDTGLQAGTCLETKRLRETFKFVDPPFGVAVDHGQVKETFGQAQFYPPQPAPELKRLGFVR